MLKPIRLNDKANQVISLNKFKKNLLAPYKGEFGSSVVPKRDMSVKINHKRSLKVDMRR